MQVAATRTTEYKKHPTKYQCKTQITTDIAKKNTPQKQSLTRMQEDMPSKSLASFMKSAENTLQDKLQAQLTSSTKHQYSTHIERDSVSQSSQFRFSQSIQYTH